MELKLKYFSVQEAFLEGEPETIGADLTVIFKEGEDKIGANIGISFEHPTPRDLTFSQVEKIAIQRVKERL
ncbi:hypothetical protein [Pseudomonas sp. EpS/L25]|uniref:hypothetical protein n=1 Tax=Pseudomonas sp. EpS/L25 TaxID=1749078 RepID=UPI0007435069|nr:hypothetical protein [Pseudomonas sp. EpS/L25]KUM43357.1 hypothetical protein AR540_24195 [Pseudomonas sp. EpS/L25]